jgi:hypothetical protein
MLDLSSNTDITAFALVFPPRDADEKYIEILSELRACPTDRPIVN